MAPRAQVRRHVERSTSDSPGVSGNAGEERLEKLAPSRKSPAELDAREASGISRYRVAMTRPRPPTRVCQRVLTPGPSAAPDGQGTPVPGAAASRAVRFPSLKTLLSRTKALGLSRVSRRGREVLLSQAVAALRKRPLTR